MSRAFSCANRPLFMRLLVENSALELVFFFSTDTLNFFLVYLSIAERRVQKQKGNAENERQRVAKSGREGERERKNAPWSSNEPGANDICTLPTPVRSYSIKTPHLGV